MTPTPKKYQELDATLPNGDTNRPHLRKKADAMGYAYISEMAIDLYRRHASSRAAAEAMGMSTTWVLNRMHQWGVRVNPKGGRHDTM